MTRGRHKRLFLAAFILAACGGGEGPTGPTGPSNPANPSNPSNPSNPGNPGNPSNPNEPATPQEPSSPFDGNGYGVRLVLTPATPVMGQPVTVSILLVKPASGARIASFSGSITLDTSSVGWRQFIDRGEGTVALNNSSPTKIDFAGANFPQFATDTLAQFSLQVKKANALGTSAFTLSELVTSAFESRTP